MWTDIIIEIDVTTYKVKISDGTGISVETELTEKNISRLSDLASITLSSEKNCPAPEDVRLGFVTFR